MKPDWKDAPDFARYLAQDADGGWFWFQNKPVFTQFWWMNTDGGMYARVRPTDCGSTLEERPVEAEEGK